MEKIIIFDLDGTLTPQRPSSISDFSRVLLPNVREKLTKLINDGYKFAIASNQGGAKPDKENRITIGQIHAQMKWIKKELQIKIIKFAIRNRKKPDPDMLIEICHEWSVSPNNNRYGGSKKLWNEIHLC